MIDLSCTTIKNLCIPLTTLAVFTLSGCSGSSDNNAPPEVSISPSFELLENESLTITAVSSDQDGTIENVVWKYESGVRLNTTSQGNELILSPIDIAEDVTSIYSITVTDNSGQTASTSTTITTRYINNAPTVFIEGINSVLEGSEGLIKLIASDPDNNLTSITWTEVSNTNLSFGVDENNNLSFFAPDVNQDTLVEFKVEAEDIEGEVATAFTSFVIEFVNVPPVAVLPASSSFEFGQTFSISGANSNDADLQSLDYSFTIVNAPNGSNARLINQDGANITLNYDVIGTYDVALVVNDGISNSETVVQSYTIFDVLDSLTLELNKPDYPLDSINVNEVPLGEVLSPSVYANYRSAGASDVTSQATISSTSGVFQIDTITNNITASSVGTDDIIISFNGVSQLISNINVVSPAFSALSVEEQYDVYEGRELEIVPNAILTNSSNQPFTDGEWVSDNFFQNKLNHSAFTFTALREGSNSYTFNPSNDNIESITTIINVLSIADIANELTTSQSSSLSFINGVVQGGSRVSPRITNTFTESLILVNIEIVEGDGLTNVYTIEELILQGITDDETLEVNETLSATYTIGTRGAILPITVNLNMADPVTGKHIGKSVTFD